MPILLTGEKYTLLESTEPHCEIKCDHASSPSSTTSSNALHHQHHKSPTYPLIQNWLRRQLMPVLIRSKINDSKASWNGSVDLSTLLIKNGNSPNKLPKSNGNRAMDNGNGNNLNNNNDCDDHQDISHPLTQESSNVVVHCKSPIDSSPISNNIQSQSAPCTPKFMMKRPPVESIFGPTIATVTTGFSCSSEIDLLSRQLTEKDKLLTDLRLELLSTEDQIEELRELIGKLDKQLVNLREENKRLNNLVDSLTPLTCFKLSRVQDQNASDFVKNNNHNNQSLVTIESTF